MFAITTGLRVLFTEAHEFVAAVRFARPGVLPLLIVPLLIGMIGWLVARRQQRKRLALGRAYTRRRVRGRFPEALAWVTLVLALAGPRWGQTDSQGVAVGRDVVVAIDFSRSMWAADMLAAKTPSRWQAAIAAVNDLLRDFQTRRTGHRVAVIVFAARPKLIVPLTTDFEHVRFRLSELDATLPPAEIRPADDKAISGTRIGAALAAAITAHDARFPGVQDVILITDGDDPGDDTEWRIGVTAARAAKIPVHVVGVGDPQQDSFILQRGGPLEMPGPNGVPTPVQTRLQEATAKAIAIEAKGEYLAADRATPDLRTWFRTTIEANATREVSDDRLPQLRDRTAWFVAVGLVLLLISWWRSTIV